MNPTCSVPPPVPGWGDSLRLAILTGLCLVPMWVAIHAAAASDSEVTRQPSAPTNTAAATPAWAQNARLAVIATDKALDPIADVLTVGLSKESGVTLLERGEINRILGEQRLAASGGSNCVRLGQLLRTDGVIVLRRARVQQQELLVADLVSVGLGLRLDVSAERFPVDNLDTWISTIKGRFGPLFPKLGVPPREAIPVSLLNLRAAVMTTEAKVLERSLSFLLAERLVRQPQVFVLERQHLGALEMDKEFIAGTEPPEWAIARFVVDGEIVQNGLEPDKIVLRIKIEPPQHQSPTVFTVAGSQRQLAQLVDETAARIIASIGRPMRESQWQPQEEAQRFCREAVSAERIGLDEEALAAGEASHALGYRSEELIALVVRQSCRKAFSGRGGLSEGYDRAQVDEATLDIGLVQHALELAGDQMTDGSELKVLLKPVHISGWTKGGPEPEVLLTAARIIRYYLETDRYDTHRPELETLRTTLRATVEKLEAQQKTMDGYNFYGFLASYAPYLYDDPRQVIDCYRRVLRHQFPGGDSFSIYATARVRHYLAEARDKPQLFGIHDLSQRTPWLVNWGHYSPQALKQVWEAFLNELSGSGNVNDRLDALLLRLYCVDDEAARDLIKKQIRESIWEQRQAIANDKFTYAIAMQLLYAIGGNDEAFRFKLLDFFFKEANFYDWQILERGFIWINVGEWGFKNTELKSALLKSMDAYADRMKGRGDFQAAEFAKYRQRLLPVAPEATGNGSARALRLWKCWLPDLSGEPVGHPHVFCIRKIIYRDPYVWVLGKKRSPGTNEPWLKLFQVDPRTFAASSLDVPLTDVSEQSSAFDMDSDFDVSPEYLFVTTHGKLLRYDRARRAWSSTEVPPSDFPALTVLGDALYYAFPGHMGRWGMAQPASGIIRIHPQSLEQEILASSRRKQSATLLDDVPAYKVPSLFLGPGGALHAVVNFDDLKVFRYGEAARDWTRVLADELEGNKGRFGLLAFPGEGGALLQRLEVTSRSAEFSAMRFDRDGRLEHLIGTGGNNTNSVGRAPWHAPESPWDYSNPPSTPLVATMDGKEYWALLKNLASPGGSLALYRYKPGSEKPTIIPISFASTQAGISNLDPSLFATPYGLVVGNTGGAAFWTIPWPELEEFLLAGRGTNSSQR